MHWMDRDGERERVSERGDLAGAYLNQDGRGDVVNSGQNDLSVVVVDENVGSEINLTSDDIAIHPWLRRRRGGRRERSGRVCRRCHINTPCSTQSDTFGGG